MNLRLTSHGERTQAEAGGVRARLAGSQVEPVRSAAAAFLQESTPSGARGFGEAGFRATKRKEEKTNRKSPGSKHRRVNAGRAPGVGEMWGAAEQSGGDPGGRGSGPQRRGKPQRETAQVAPRSTAARDSETDTGCAHPLPYMLRGSSVTRPPANGSLPPGPGYYVQARPLLGRSVFAR